MSLLIDVLTKSDHANADSAKPDTESSRAEDHREDPAPQPEAAPPQELALEPDPEPPAAAASSTAASPDADAPAGESFRFADAGTTMIAPAPRRGRRLHRVFRSRAAQLGAVIALAAGLGALYLLDGAPHATPEGPAWADVERPAATDPAPVADETREPGRGASPAEIGPPADVAPAPRIDEFATRVEVAPAAREPVAAAIAAAEPETDAPPERIVVSRSQRDDPLFRDMRRAYEAFRDGDYAGAIDAYRAVLERDPLHVDALLGLAALALRTGDVEEARARYEAVLDLDPRNSIAIANLVAMQEGGSPVDRESYLKNMLYERPTAAHLYFSLGLQYANQSRWSDAQQAFFDAFSNDPTNADYAFNLAVSLDRLGQPRAAADYYRRTLDLAGGHHAVDTDAVRGRLRALEAAGGEAGP